jgi:putative transposase
VHGGRAGEHRGDVLDKVHKIGNVHAALPKPAHPVAKKACQDLQGQNKAAAVKAAHTLRDRVWGEVAQAVAKIVDDLDVLTAFYDYPSEHWIHLRTTNPIESTFATVSLPNSGAGTRGVSLSPRG